RSEMGTIFAEDFGTSRTLDLAGQEKVTVNVFADTSVLEIFVNDGAYVMSSRIFTPSNQHTHIFADGTDNNLVYPLQK
ncbi:MAG: hypothetical protein B7Z25_03985, partial [Aerococcus viridans]